MFTHLPYGRLSSYVFHSHVALKLYTITILTPYSLQPSKKKQFSSVNPDQMVQNTVNLFVYMFLPVASNFMVMNICKVLLQLIC